MVLKLVTKIDNPILRADSKPVKKIDAKMRELAVDMRETMFRAKGIGLAAPQVGHNIRLVLVLINFGTPQQNTITMFNPAVSNLSDDMETMEEGCLSLPKLFGDVKRHTSLTVRYQDLKGRPCVLKLSHLNARVVQHELDHINGILYRDRMENSDSPFADRVR